MSRVFLFSVVCPRLKGCHPRHPPQTFPLGLLPPICLGVLLFLAIAPLRGRCSGRTQVFGGRKKSPPQLRLGSCSASLRILQSKTGLTQPARTTPFLVFISEFILTLEFRDSYFVGAHPLVMDALTEMSEAQIQIRLTQSV